MAEELDGSAGAQEALPSSSPLSKKMEEPGSLPGGRSSAAERRVVWRSASEIEALLVAFGKSGASVRDFAETHGLHASTLYTWLRRARQGEPVRRSRVVRGRQVFSAEARRGALEAWSKSGLTAIAFSGLWGVSPESLRGWRNAYELGGPRALEPKKLGRPSGEGRSTLPSALQSEIVRTKRRFPFFGLKKVRDFLKRFAGQSVSTGGVRKVLVAEGLHERPAKPRRRKRPLVRRFERSRPGELWQTDITSFVLSRSGVRVYLVVFLDDFSRYVVSWKLATSQRSELVCEALMEGIERFGKPKEILSDQGRQYFAWRGKADFQRLLAREGIEHVVARTHHPETLGKCERLWETIGTELWERARPQELAEARERLGHYFAQRKVIVLWNVPHTPQHNPCVKDRLVRSTPGSVKLVHQRAAGKVAQGGRQSRAFASWRIAADRLEKSRLWFGQAGPPSRRRAPGLRERFMPLRGIGTPHGAASGGPAVAVGLALEHDALRHGEITDPELTAELLAIVDTLVFADRTLAEVALREASEAGGDPEELQEAGESFAEGDALVAAAAKETDLRLVAALLYTAMDGAYRHAWDAAIDSL